MPLSDKLDDLLTLSRRVDSAERVASQNVPFGQVDPVPLRTELDGAKTTLLEDCLSKSETVGYLRELQQQEESRYERSAILHDVDPEVPDHFEKMKHYRALVTHIRWIIHAIENDTAVPKPSRSS